VDAYACVDPESTLSWIDDHHARRNRWIDNRSRIVDLPVDTILGLKTPSVHGLVIRSADGRTETKLPMLYATQAIPATHANIPTPTNLRSFPHLQHVASEFLPLDETKPILLLLGRDWADVLGFTELVPSPGPGLPAALKSPYGWSVTICNDSTSKVCSKIRSSKISNQTSILFQPPASDPTCQMVMDIMQKDFQDPDPTNTTTTSLDEQKFLTQARESCHLTETGQYELKLPFKNGEPILPDNEIMAKKYLQCQIRKMESNPQYKDDYITFFEDMRSSGYFEPVPTCPKEPGRKNYIPRYIPPD
jgi:hypothetical protein